MTATYYGTTAASSVTNPPIQVVQGVNGQPNFWSYQAGVTSTDVKTANFFTDAKKLGMKQHDVVFVTNTSTSAPKAWFGVLGAVSTSGAALSSAASSTSA